MLILPLMALRFTRAMLYCLRHVAMLITAVDNIDVNAALMLFSMSSPAYTLYTTTVTFARFSRWLPLRAADYAAAFSLTPLRHYLFAEFRCYVAAYAAAFAFFAARFAIFDVAVRFRRIQRIIAAAAAPLTMLRCYAATFAAMLTGALPAMATPAAAAADTFRHAADMPLCVALDACLSAMARRLCLPARSAVTSPRHHYENIVVAALSLFRHDAAILLRYARRGAMLIRWRLLR